MATCYKKKERKKNPPLVVSPSFLRVSDEINESQAFGREKKSAAGLLVIIRECFMQQQEKREGIASLLNPFIYQSCWAETELSLSLFIGAK